MAIPVPQVIPPRPWSTLGLNVALGICVSSACSSPRSPLGHSGKVWVVTLEVSSLERQLCCICWAFDAACCKGDGGFSYRKVESSSTWTENFQMFKLLRRGRGTRAEVANICWIIEKARKFQKNIYFCFIDYGKAFDFVNHNKLWKILKDTGIPDHLTCILRNQYAGQKTTVRTLRGTTDWF